MVLATRSNSRTQQAFTLVEMLVVIAILAILASLLLPALARAKDKGRQAFCQNSLRQVGLAFQLYHGDYDDQFPAPGSKQRYGPQPEDWIWWQYGRGVSNSSIAKFVSGFNPKLFTCPSDREAQDLQAQGSITNEPYRYSYALTSYDLQGEQNLGMSTIITQDRKIYPFRARSVIRPSAKLMLVEEDRATIDDPRWVPHGRVPNLVSPRHAKKGNVVFADGHLEIVTQDFGLNPTNSQPAL
ncbi:MAG: DUF1559 domain-containing protein [Verrucomicrobiota bacterium]